MANWFEDFTKTIADEKLTRRQVAGRIAGVVAGATFAAWLPEQVLAKNIPWKKQCPNGGCAPCFGADCNNCVGNPNGNCFCFSGTPSPAPNRKGFCGCNSYCSQTPVCVKQSDCPRGTFCTYYTACSCPSITSGVCIAECKGMNKNCQLGNGHGPTITGRLL